MNRLPIPALLLSLLLGASTANAATITVFSDVNFGGSGSQTFTEPAIPQWSHTLNFTPAAGSIVSATIEVRHAGNIPGIEPWSLSSQSNVPIGDLGLSWFFVDFFTSDTFTIPVSLFPAFPSSSWTLALKLTESSGGNDSIKLDWARLSVTYNDVPAATTPEPATLTLLGTGIATAFWRRRRQRRQNA